MDRILVIDDEPEAIDVVKLLLRNEDYEIEGISNPLFAGERIQSFFPDLIILDWQMQEMDGISVLHEIKNNAIISHIPVIISTGIRTNSMDLKYALDLGASDYISKPVDPIVLRARVASNLRVSRSILALNKEHILDYEAQLDSLIKEDGGLDSGFPPITHTLLTAAINVYQNKQLLAKLRKEIIDGTSTLDMSSKTQILQVFNKYEILSNTQSWSQFEEMYDDRNKMLFDKLVAKYPTLSSNDLRICSFLKLGLSYKEIASLSYSSYTAIRKAGYRIRKKLDLDQETNIAIFLQTL